VAEGEEGNSENLLRRWELLRPFEENVQLEEAWAKAKSEENLRNGLDFSNSWTSIGAGITNIADTTYNRTGRTTYATYAIDTTQSGNPTVLYTSGCNGGIWKALLLGIFAVMVPIGDNLPGSPSVGGFIVWPNSSSYIICGTGDYNRAGGTGLYRTDNHGASWYKSAVDVGNPTSIYRMVQDVNNWNRIVVATDAGLYTSDNFGLSYTRRQTGHFTDVIQDPNTYNNTTGYIMYAGARSTGMWRSLDWGTSWTNLSSGITGSVGRVSVGFCRNNGAFVYCGVGLPVSGGENLNGIYRSSNYGGSWTPIGPATDLISYGQSFHTGAVAVDPNNANNVIVSMGGSIRSTNAAATTPTWAGFDGGHADYRYMTYRPGTNSVMICNDGGFYLYDFDSGSRNATINTLGLNVTQVMQPVAATAVSRQDPSKMLAGLQDNGMVNIQIGASPTIRNLGGGDGASASISPDNFNNVAFSSGFGFGRFYNTALGATSWVDVRRSTMTTNWGPPSAYGHQIQVDQAPNYAVNLYAMDGRIPYYQGIGAPTPTGWVNMIAGGGQLSWTGKSIESVTNQNAYAYYVSEWGGGRVAVLEGTPGACTVFDRTPPGMSGRSDCIVTADKSIVEPDTVYYVTGYSNPGRAFVSYNRGVSWTNVTGDSNTIAPNAFYWQLAVLPNNHNVLFLSTSVGVLRSDNGGLNWYKFMKGLPATIDCQNMMLSYDNITGAPKLRIGTYGRGWWERVIENAPYQTVNVGFYTAESARSSYSGTVIFQPLDSEQATITYAPSGFGNNVWIPLNVPTGQYRVWFKPDYFLAQAGTINVTTSGAVYWYLNGSKGGDADRDNIVSILDYLILSSQFELELGNPGFTGAADFDGDNIVSILDYLILSANFELEGAPE
jgi:hypothetical protein